MEVRVTASKLARLVTAVVFAAMLAGGLSLYEPIKAKLLAGKQTQTPAVNLAASQAPEVTETQPVEPPEEETEDYPIPDHRIFNDWQRTAIIRACHTAKDWERAARMLAESCRLTDAQIYFFKDVAPLENWSGEANIRSIDKTHLVSSWKLADGELTKLRSVPSAPSELKPQNDITDKADLNIDFLTWTSKAGNRSTKAKIVGVTVTAMKLEKPDGQVVNVPLELLDEKSKTQFGQAMQGTGINAELAAEAESTKNR